MFQTEISADAFVNESLAIHAFVIHDCAVSSSGLLGAVSAAAVIQNFSF
jgi:hypothetical protein